MNKIARALGVATAVIIASSIAAVLATCAYVVIRVLLHLVPVA